MYVGKQSKVGLPTLIHVCLCLQNNFICYAFEGHINVGWGGQQLALEPPVEQPGLETD